MGNYNAVACRTKGCAFMAWKQDGLCQACQNAEREARRQGLAKRDADRLAYGEVGDPLHAVKNLAEFDAMAREHRAACGLPPRTP